MTEKFRDRYEGGRELAAMLGDYAHERGLLVLALPRGGVPVGFEVASALSAPLDVFLVRKLGVPGHEELAMGAIATGDVLVLNDDVVQNMRIPSYVIEDVASIEWQELERREQAYRDGRPPPDPHGRTVILVDDGLATGSTMRAAVQALRGQGAARIVVAVPVAARQTCNELRNEADDVVCARTPDPFYAVGLWYDDFTPTSDQEIHDLLQRDTQHHATGEEESPQSESADAEEK